MDAADFVIRLIDKATAPAKRIASAFATIEKSMKPVKKNAAFKAFDKAGDKLWDFGKAAVLTGAAVGLGLAGALTKASLDAVMFSENTQLAFTQLTHSAAGGKQAFDTVRTLVGDLGLDLHETTDGFRRLLAAQFSIQESTELLKMSADLSAIGIHGEEAGRVLTALSQIKAKGKLQAEEMMQLAEAGISLTLVNGQLQKALGKTGAEVDKMKQAGQISGQIGIDAIKEAVKEKLGIEQFGDARKKFVNSNLSGMIESLKAASDLLFLRLGDSVKGAAKAMGPLVKDTMAWVQTLDTSSITTVVESVLGTLRALIPVGREFVNGFLAGFGQVADGLRIDIDASSLKAAAEAGHAVAQAIGMIISGVRIAASALSFFTTPVGKVVLGFGLLLVAGVKIVALVSSIAGAVGALTPIFAAIPTILGVFITIVSSIVLAIGAIPLAIGLAIAAVGLAIYNWWGEIGAFFGVAPAKWSEWGHALGTALLDGLTLGLYSGLPLLLDKVGGVASSVIAKAEGVLGIHSPSKEFEKLGAYSSEGFAIGMQKGAPSLQSASSAALAAPALSGAPTGGGGGGSPVINLNIQVDGGGKDDQALAHTIADVSVAKLILAFESLTNPSPAPA